MVGLGLEIRKKIDNIELAKIELEREAIFCNKCIVSSMCKESCENFHNDIINLLPQHVDLNKFKESLADDIRKAVVNTSFQTIKVVFQRRITKYEPR